MRRLIWFLLIVSGVMIALLGIGIDFVLPGTSPGVNLPQLLIVAFGLALSVVAYKLMRRQQPNTVIHPKRSKLLAAAALALGTLVILELAVAATGTSTYSQNATLHNLSPSPYLTCDNSGCHLVYEAVSDSCSRNETSGRICTVNRQGYLGPHDFAPIPVDGARVRLLILGDSFTFGQSADFGRSYVEVIQARFPEAAIWNTGIPGAGTVQAVASFNAFAPLLRPQLTILGFFMNDFTDNLLPLNGRWNMVDPTGKRRIIAKWYLDRWGNLREAETPTSGTPFVSRLRGPVNEFESVLGSTQLGSLLLRALDMIAHAISAPRVVELETEQTHKYLRDLRDAVADQGGKLLILLIPRSQDLALPSERFQLSSRLIEESGIPYMNPIELLDSVADYSPPRQPLEQCRSSKDWRATQRVCVRLHRQRQSCRLRQCYNALV